MLLKFIWICIIFILVGVGFIFYRQQHFSVNMSTLSFNTPLQVQEAVKGISTNKAEEISNQLKRDLDGGINQAQRQVLDLKVSDIYSFFSKGQKIPGDFQSLQENIKRDIESFNKNK